MGATYPQAPAILKRSRGVYLWIVPRCALCGRKHQDGGGPLTGDPRALLGHRVRHCATQDRRVGEPSGYDLVEAAGGRETMATADRRDTGGWAHVPCPRRAEGAQEA